MLDAFEAVLYNEIHSTERYELVRTIMNDVVNRLRRTGTKRQTTERYGNTCERDFVEMGFVLGGLCEKVELLYDLEGNNDKEGRWWC